MNHITYLKYKTSDQCAIVLQDLVRIKFQFYSSICLLPLLHVVVMATTANKHTQALRKNSPFILFLNINFFH